MTEQQRCAWHPNELTGVSCQRCGRHICPNCQIIASVGFQCPECAKDKQTVKTLNSFSQPRITQLIIGICVAAFVFSFGNTNEFFFNYGINPVFVLKYGEYWRIITSMFLHANFMHIAFNMLALWQVGFALENRIGKYKFAVIFFLTGIGGGLLSAYMNEPFAFSVGASGAVFGLFGAWIAINRRLNFDSSGLMAMIAINLGLGFVIPGIDWHGHLGGLLTGLVLGNIVQLRKRR
ncbi:MAG: hypothetical protein RLZZ330_659 [Actinomycetota bacterium]